MAGRSLYPAVGAVYVALVPTLAKLAREKGYALAVHGSLNTDLDLVAVPWTNEAVSAEELATAILKAVDGHFREVDVLDHNPAAKPHGRLAWSIYFVKGGPYIDLSIMPRTVDKTNDYGSIPSGVYFARSMIDDSGRSVMGDEGALDHVIDGIKDKLRGIISHWKIGRRARFHVAMSVDLPENWHEEPGVDDAVNPAKGPGQEGTGSIPRIEPAGGDQLTSAGFPPGNP